jgi:hypothetical protein
MHSSLRQEHPTIANIIQHGSRNGYKILYLLAKQAGKHPLLIRYPFDPPEPVQSADTTIEQYLTKWTQYLQHRLLDGTIYCDRYFIQQFQRNLHPSVQAKIGPKIEQAVDKIDISRSLPKSFGPDELFQQHEDFAEFVHMPIIMRRTPRNAFQSSSAVVNELRNNRSSATTTDNDEIDLPAIIAAINNTTAPTCFLCEATEHRMAQCPAYTRLQNNPRAITAILRDLKQKRPPPRNRNRQNPPNHIRQLEQTLDIPNEIGEGSSPTSTLAGEGATSTTKFDDDATASHDAIPDELISDFL